MNRPPEILLNSGFVTDANGVLTEMVIPNNVTTQNMPSIITTYATTINWLPSNTTTLVKFSAHNIQSGIASGLFKGFTSLQEVTFSSLTSYTVDKYPVNSGLFYGCTSLLRASLPSLKTCNSIGSGGESATWGHGMFLGCTSLIDVSLPSLESIGEGGSNNGMFYGCSSLVNIVLPSLVIIKETDGSTQNSNYGGTFCNCTGLQNVQLGSTGHPVTSLLANCFRNCTQSGLTITIYTTGGAALSGSPWGATNATIEYEEA